MSATDLAPPQNCERRRFIVGLSAIALTGALAAVSRASAAEEGVISAEEAFAAARNGEIHLIDVRSFGEWRETGLPAGAKAVTIHNPDGLSGFVQEIKNAVGDNPEKPIALICAVGGRSSAAQKLLRQAGYQQVLNVREGMIGNSRDGEGWLAKGLPTESCNC